MKRSPSLSFLTCLAPALLAFGLAGCTTEATYTHTLYTGQRITFRLINGAAEHAKIDGIETDNPKIDPDPKEHKFRYLVHLHDASGAGLKSVKVEDVSDDKPVMLVDDEQPKLTNHVWAGISAPYDLSDESSKWLTYLDESVRVYRFTVVRPDGHPVVLYESLILPPFVKAYLRQGVLGGKY